MILESRKTLLKMSYSSVTKELVLHYNNGDMETYKNVPEAVYEQIKANGRVLTQDVSNTLTNYQKVQMV